MSVNDRMIEHPLTILADEFLSENLHPDAELLFVLPKAQVGRRLPPVEGTFPT